MLHDIFLEIGNFEGSVCNSNTDIYSSFNAINILIPEFNHDFTSFITYFIEKI